MKTCQLSPNLAAREVVPAERSEEALIIGEICERITELAEMSSSTRARTAKWLMRVAALFADRESTDAGWLYLRLSTGDLSQLTSSFSEMGGARHRTKQAEQQEQERALKVIARHFPELQSAIVELLQKRSAASGQKTAA